MPKIDRTERSVRIDGKPLPYDTGRGGQAIGEGISAFGNALSRLGREQTAEAEAQELFDTKMSVDEYTHRQALEADDRIANYNETQHGPPGEFDARYAAEREARDKEFVTGLSGSPKAQRWAMMQVQNARQSAIMRAQNARQGFVQQSNIARVMAMVDNAGDAMDGNPETVATAHAKIAQDVAIVPGLTPAQRNRAMDVASKKLWDKWLLKADEAQLERGLADYHKGRAEWSKQFEKDEAPSGDLREIDRTDTRLPQGGAIKPRGIVFHHTSGTTSEGAIATLRKRGLSYNYLIEPDGTVVTLVPGGKSSFHMKPDESGRGLGNHDTIGISFVARNNGAVTEKQREVGRTLAAREAEKYGIGQDMVFGHGDLNAHKEKDEGHAVVGDIRRNGFARISVGGGGKPAPLSTSPEAEAPDGTMPAPLKRFALPDRATPYDHMVNNFGDIAPKVQERLEKFREHREAVAKFGGIISGQIPWNFNDTKERDEYNKLYRSLGVGAEVAKGNPQALAIAAAHADKTNYVTPDVYAGLKTLTDSPDTKKKIQGYTAALGFYDKNPNIFDQHGDKSMLVEAEKFRRYSRFMDPDKAVAYMIEQNTPGSKLHKAATKDEVEKFLKKYEGENGLGEVAKDMDEGWSKTFGVLGAFSRPTTNADHKVRAAILHDYREALRIGYETQGSETGAKSYASVLMRSRYGVSNLFGREALMDYPPERMFAPDAKGSHAYIEKEARELAGIYNTNADPATVRLRTRPVSEWHEGKPTYSIVINRKDNGLEEVVPQRFQPGNPMADEKAAFEAARAKAVKPTSAVPGGAPNPYGVPQGGGAVPTIVKEVGAAGEKATKAVTPRVDKANEAADRIGESVSGTGLKLRTAPLNPQLLGTKRRAPSVGGE